MLPKGDEFRWFSVCGGFHEGSGTGIPSEHFKKNPQKLTGETPVPLPNARRFAAIHVESDNNHDGFWLFARRRRRVGTDGLRAPRMRRSEANGLSVELQAPVPRPWAYQSAS